MSSVTDRATVAGSMWAAAAAPADLSRLDRFAESLGDDLPGDDDSRSLAELAFEAIHPSGIGDAAAARVFWGRVLGNDTPGDQAVLDFITGALPDREM
jgi:hypothetical protein